MNSNPTSTSSTSSPASADAISRRAYEIWEQEGRPENGDLRHWLQAEQELGARTSSGGSSSSSSASASAAAKNTDRPLQGTRAAAPAKKNNSTSPFGERAAPSGGQTAGTKRR